MASSSGTFRVLPGGGPSADPWAPAGWQGPTPSARPGDRCEPWPAADACLPAALPRAAASARISLALAVIVSVERALIVDDIAELGLEWLIDDLDEAASAARVQVELAEPSSAYLRALDGAPGTAPLPRGDLRLPMRLIDRTARRDPKRLIDPAALGSAVRWERAAVLSGRTMSDWAGGAMLAALRG